MVSSGCAIASSHFSSFTSRIWAQQASHLIGYDTSTDMNDAKGLGFLIGWVYGSVL